MGAGGSRNEVDKLEESQGEELLYDTEAGF